MVTERVSGAGGEALAVGLQNADGSLRADVQKLEITATGGVGGGGISTYGNINGARLLVELPSLMASMFWWIGRTFNGG
mgnify:CR=1 FL=1